jgi:hypothetical protein
VTTAEVEEDDEDDKKAKKRKTLFARAASRFNLNVLAEKLKKEEETDEESTVKSRHPILDQPVFVGGKEVSGAFAQAISLARVFVRTSAKIVILGNLLQHCSLIFSEAPNNSLSISIDSLSHCFTIYNIRNSFFIKISIRKKMMESFQVK